MAVVLGISALSLRADVKMPAIFGDHMVLQQGATLPVWGTAEPGEKLTVTVGAEKAVATADANGKWKVTLPALPNGTPPTTMTVAGKNTLTFSDVLVGEVWLCGGQSNMEFPMSRVLDAKTEMTAANDPQLRLFLVAHRIALTPIEDVKGQWQVCTPDSVRSFSAVGYYFGQRLRTALKEPVGLIGSYWGGTPAQVWMSPDSLEKTPGLGTYADAYKGLLAAYPKGEEDYESQMATATAAQQKWRDDCNHDPAYQAAMKAWVTASTQVTPGQPQPPRPAPPIPQPPMPLGSGPLSATLYNGMIAPLIPYPLKGTIWFQADGNMGHPSDYGLLIQTLIKDWRAQWGAEMPFYYVEMNNMRDMPQTLPVQENNLSLIREQQEAALELPATGVVCSIDLGLPIPEPHFPNKKPVGVRLANLTLNDLYHQPGPVNSPAFKSSHVEGNKIRLTFTNATGLHATTPDGTLKGFAIRAAGGTWLWAQGRIDHDAIVVWNDQVPQPSDVRYAWACNPVISVANGADLPLRPFRTDKK